MTRRTVFTGSAESRRRERRAHLQSEVSKSADKLHRPTPSRVELQCKRKPMSQADKLTPNEYTLQIEAAAERVTLSLGKRKNFDTVRPGATHIVNARQKMRGKSIPAYYD